MDSALLDYLPPPLLVALNEYVWRDNAPLQTWSRVFVSQAQRAADAVQPTTARVADMVTPAVANVVASVVTPFFDRVARAAYNAPDVVVLLSVLVLVVLVLQVLALVRRILAWWTRLLFRLLFWAAVAVAVSAVWQRGLEQTAQDTAAIAGRLCGYAAFVGDIWRAEYNKYQQQQMQAQAANGGGGGSGGGSGGYYGGATHSYQY